MKHDMHKLSGLLKLMGNCKWIITTQWTEIIYGVSVYTIHIYKNNPFNALITIYLHI